MQQYVDQIVSQVITWDEIEGAAHRFGGTEFLLGKVEIGHIHRHGMVDIPFTRKMRERLVADGKARQHHLLHDSGWISFYIRGAEDVEKALWLYRLSYLQKRLARSRNKPQAQEAILQEAESGGFEAYL